MVVVLPIPLYDLSKAQRRYVLKHINIQAFYAFQRAVQEITKIIDCLGTAKYNGLLHEPTIHLDNIGRV